MRSRTSPFMYFIAVSAAHLRAIYPWVLVSMRVSRHCETQTEYDSTATLFFLPAAQRFRCEPKGQPKSCLPVKLLRLARYPRPRGQNFTPLARYTQNGYPTAPKVKTSHTPHVHVLSLTPHIRETPSVISSDPSPTASGGIANDTPAQPPHLLNPSGRWHCSSLSIQGSSLFSFDVYEWARGCRGCYSSG